MPDRRTPRGELAALALLFAFLLWVPLPFGSTPDPFQLAFVCGALIVCIAATLAVLASRAALALSPAHRAWSGGAVLFMLVVALQLLPLPDALLRLVSPESARIWSAAARVAALVIPNGATAHTVSVDPTVTTLHLFRLLAYFAVFTAAALVVRRHAWRLAFAVVLVCGGVFQAVYGIREATLHRFAIWGWKNTLMFDRVTGTFVNPNHFANYLALVAPMGFFILSMAWHEASPTRARLLFRLARLFERRVLPAVFGIGAVLACTGGILLSKSRGALLALFAGCAIGFAVATGRRLLRAAFFAAAFAAVVLAMALYLGRERTTLGRVPTAAEAMAAGGRRGGIETALAIWKRYPLFGSGLGTFGVLAPMLQPSDLERVYNHAHDDYAEIAATTGLVGLLAFVIPLGAGLLLFIRAAFVRPSGSWRRRAFYAAALASISVALVHSLIDFNFFIPANAATLAAIAGAAVATRSAPAAERGSASTDSPR
jgi:putative inorganic carbon (HCO3(-)) transporter